jgi:hypothetical protein
VTAVLMIGSALLASGGAFALWDWTCRQVVARQDRQHEAQLERSRGW